MSIRTAALAAVSASIVAASFGAAEAQAQTLARMENTVAVFDEVTADGRPRDPDRPAREGAVRGNRPRPEEGRVRRGRQVRPRVRVVPDDSGWSAPSGVRMEGGSVGFQIGGTEIDVILTIMNKRGVDRLLSNKFTLGADASASAGPIGRTASAQTDAAMTAEILSWSRSRGVFAGRGARGRDAAG